MVCCLLWCNVVQSGNSVSTFRKSFPLLSNDVAKVTAASIIRVDEGVIWYLWKVCTLLPDYTMSHVICIFTAMTVHIQMVTQLNDEISDTIIKRFSVFTHALFSFFNPVLPLVVFGVTCTYIYIYTHTTVSVLFATDLVFPAFLIHIALVSSCRWPTKRWSSLTSTAFEAWLWTAVILWQTWRKLDN